MVKDIYILLSSYCNRKNCLINLVLTYYANRYKAWFVFNLQKMTLCLFLWLRSHLQVSVYRLCELTFDTAAGHAVHVSDDPSPPGPPKGLLHMCMLLISITSTYQRSFFQVVVCLLKCPRLRAPAERTCSLIACRAASWLLAHCAPLSALCGSENK